MILVPTLIALMLGYLRISTELATADEFSRTVTQVDLSSTIEELVHDIQGERDLVVSRVAAGRTGDRSAVAAQIDTVDRGVAQLQAAADSITPLDQAVRTRYDDVVAGLETLEAIRETAEQTLFPASDTQFVYDSVIGSLLQLNREITRVSDDRAISEQATRIDAIAGAKEQLAIQNSILRAAALSGAFGPGELARLRSAQAELTAELTAFQDAADPAALTRYAHTVAGAEVDDRLRLQQNALNQGDAGTPVTINIQELVAAADATLNKLRQVETDSLRDLRDTAQRLTTTARTNAIRDAVLIVVALLLALLLMHVVARSLLNPLRVLRRDALDVAHRRLPATVNRILADPDPLTASENAVDPVPVHTTEEVGQVARAIDALQDQAVKLATEQAIMRDTINTIFVNLARRSQTLVERQLGLIDALEQDEQDPDQLANLFELDHLATRMRRNSESLLVLSGTGLSRRNNRPVPVSEVVDAAKSEVEDYARIEVAPAPDVLVQQRAVSDLVHLLAELLDNATQFSPRDRKVTVRMKVPRGHDLLIQITDTGLGMTEEDIREANQRLADPPDLDVTVTRRMGLYVVARLAKKHHIAVRLRANDDIEGGVVARITVPVELITFSSTSTATNPSTTPTETSPAVMAGMLDSTTGAGSISQAFTSGRQRALTTLPPVSDGAPTRTAHVVDPSTTGITDNTMTHHRTPEPATTTQVDQQTAEHWTAPADAGPDSVDTGHAPTIEPIGTDDPPTARLPIYEAVLSQWFSTPADADIDTTAAPATDDPSRPSHDTDRERPHGDESTVDRHSGPRSWPSTGDAGWQAARAMLNNSIATTTASGLPKRVPQARLIPGSAAPRHEERQDQGTVDTTSVPAALPLRSADMARARMSSIQQGTRRGRHALISNQADTSGHHHRSERT